MPFLGMFNRMANALTSMLQAFSRWEHAGKVMVGLVTAGAIVATYQLTRLGFAALEAAANFKIAQGLMQGPIIPGVGKAGGWLKSLGDVLSRNVKGGGSTAMKNTALFGWVFKIGDLLMKHLPWLARIGPMIGRIGAMATSPITLGVIIAGGVGWAVGKAFDKAFPGNWIHALADATGKASMKQNITRASYLAYTPKTVKKEDVLDQIRMAVLQGKEGDVSGILDKNASHVKGLVRKEGLAAFMNDVKSTMTSARERVGLTGVTGRNDAAERIRDEKLVELTRQIAEGAEIQAKLLKKVTEQQAGEQRMNELMYEQEVLEKKIKASPEEYRSIHRKYDGS